MILDVTRFLRQHRRASLADLAAGLGATPAALEGMLATLERKGRVRRLPPGPACGGSCCKCAPEALAVFEWVGD